MVLYYFLILGCISLAASDDFVFPCLTPNDEKGLCISIFSCPVLQKSLGTLQPSAIDFIKRSVCRRWAADDLKVCCGNSGNFVEMQNVSSSTDSNQQVPDNNNIVTDLSKPSQNVPKPENVSKNETHRDYVIRRLLPTIKYCGLQHTDDRFYNETETALDEFPWLAHVIFFDEEEDGEDTLEFADRCNGVLINRRYVLTNGYCARNPKKVRLGQYNTNQTISCVQNPDFSECTEPTLEIRVEEEIHHGNDEYGWYGFALFRLAHNIIYTDFIRPICLPFHDPRQVTKQETLVFSGWGAADQKGVVKKRLTYDTTDVEECYKLDEELKAFSVNASLVCLVPQEDNEDLACAGDEGSPLMYSYKHQWFADAIITTVYRDPGDDCSNKLPVDGIRITPEVFEWILETIRD